LGSALKNEVSLLVSVFAIDAVKWYNVCNLDGSQLVVANSHIKKHIS